MQNEEVTVGKILITEYERLKEEQKVRIGFRDNLLYVSIAAVAAVIAATLPARLGPPLLLLIPPVSIVLGWTYLMNDEKISAIGRYIRDDLGPRLSNAAGISEPVFGWEVQHRHDARRRSRKVLQLCTDILTFIAAPLAGLTVLWTVGSLTPALIILSIAEAIGVLVLATQVVRYADLGSGP